ncbi:MAG: hypothetical protein SPG53_03145 [Prevotella sp.]|nr:hypothetical protein [Prevotella sp.]
MISIKNFWKIWQFFSRTYVLYLQEYIDEICSELTTFAVESPTDGGVFYKRSEASRRKNRRQEVHIRQLSLNFAV